MPFSDSQYLVRLELVRPRENQCKRALELNPNSSDAHGLTASAFNLGRHSEALVEIKRARELDPLDLLINAREAQILVYAGQTDDALAALQKTFEMDPNYGSLTCVASRPILKKECLTKPSPKHARRENYGRVGSHTHLFVGYALAKSGKQAEARAELNELLKLVKPALCFALQSIAMIYGGLGDRDETFAWLERGFKAARSENGFSKSRSEVE